ncbi:hypothetical protein [Lentzea californiensis]|uniref:hypothetical protein n=1 Tax=Lentzea californiensis TaxID=438851 RepID=UPI0021657DE7|nr:hypothetical protein [Lentzea californiensis]MCR3752251.1 hypothetical protein [Lentzea californiensis]
MIRTVVLTITASFAASLLTVVPASAAYCQTEHGVFVPEKSSGVPSLWAPTGSIVTIKPNQQSRIWAGVAFTGTNGPPGWVDLAPWSFPLPDRPVFSLITRISNNYSPTIYRYAGYDTSFVNNQPNPGFVILRTNDDHPGNGSGAFIADVSVCT